MRRRVYVTDHALLRYLERVGGFEIDLLRRSMEARRDAPGLVHLIFRVLGLAAKREQYRDGARFCRAVLDAAGVDALNLAFAAPDLLPDPAELHDPDRWLRRVPARVG